MTVRNIPARINLISTTQAVIYTCPQNTSALIIAATATNTATDSARLLSGHIVDAGSSALPDNKVIESLPIDRLTDEYIANLHGQVLSGGQFISFNLDDVGTVNVSLTIQEQV